MGRIARLSACSLRIGSDPRNLKNCCFLALQSQQSALISASFLEFDGSA